MRRWLWMVSAFVLGACGVLSADNPAATQQAEVTAFHAESTAIGERIVSASTQSAATAVAAETYIALVDGINRQVVATLRASLPPTPQIVTQIDPSLPVGTRPATVGDEMPMDDTMSTGQTGGFTEFLQFTQTASSVRASDGCAENVTNQFATSSEQIYATARALNVTAGTEMGVEWSFGGEVVFSSSFVVEQNNPDFCFWFFITPADVPFTAGDWSVRMLVNGAPVQPFAFTISG